MAFQLLAALRIENFANRRFTKCSIRVLSVKIETWYQAATIVQLGVLQNAQDV